ncbi:pilus assembly protein TadG-related protein [Streptomyces litchfieldiae]|uniref:pilus assembly protein TadG-related protein n=1 Tax=Streptomyces litchfieldiae TaxID=3075543 RepID=UPI00374E0636
MVSGLLAVAFVCFAFAQAAVTRSAAQSAADAAALAAAGEARDHLFDGFLGVVGGEGEEDLGHILGGEDFYVPAACDEAAPRLADRNGADVVDCFPDDEGLGITVIVETRETMGDSMIPGTEDEKARAEATAVIRGLCELTTEEDERVELDCDEAPDWDFDPEDEEDLPDARDLFQVYLED